MIHAAAVGFPSAKMHRNADALLVIAPIVFAVRNSMRERRGQRDWVAKLFVGRLAGWRCSNFKDLFE